MTSNFCSESDTQNRSEELPRSTDPLAAKGSGETIDTVSDFKLLHGEVKP